MIDEPVTREFAGRRATFSQGDRYRYRLGEVWNADRPGLLFVMRGTKT
jgi:hypothetical protein